MKSGACVLAVLASVSILSSIMPTRQRTFFLSFSAVKATHIVVASEGRRVDGRLEVIESWKGDLREGEELDVPELAQFAPKTSRVVYRRDRQKPRPVTGDRMILFLVKSLAPGEDTDREANKDTPPVTTRWLPAARPEYLPVFGQAWPSPDERQRMKIAVAWVDWGNVHSFHEVLGGETVVLAPMTPVTEDDMKARVLGRTQSTHGLDRAAAVPDPVQRAEGLLPFTMSKDARSCERAFNALAECGAAALPHLRKILADEKLLSRHHFATRYMAKAVGTHAGPDLIKVLEDELALWKSRAPTLKGLRWNDQPRELKLRHVKLEQTVQAVDWLRCSDARDIVTAIRDYWQTQPKLARLKSLIVARCDAYLRREDARRPR